MFKRQFVELIKSGKKRQTIRPVPRRMQDMPKVGQVESWRYWEGQAYRSPQVEIVKVILTEVDNITIVSKTPFGNYPVLVHDTWKDPDVAEQIARMDGFKSNAEMGRWFEDNHGLPFSGIIIRAI